MKFESPETKVENGKEFRDRPGARGVLRKIVTELMFAAALTSGTAGLAQEKPKVEGRQEMRIELSDQNKRSIYSFFDRHKAETSARAMIEEVRRSSTGQELSSDLNPRVVEKADIVLTGADVFPWLKKDAKGEEHVELIISSCFDSTATETEEDIKIDFPLEGGKNESIDGGGLMWITFRKYFDTDKASEDIKVQRFRTRVGAFDEFDLVRPKYGANPQLYADSVKRLNESYALRENSSAPDGVEYVNAGQEHEWNAGIAARLADDREALFKILDFSKKMGLRELTDATQEALRKMDIDHEFFSR